MKIKIDSQITIDEFIEHILPYAYEAGLHRVPAKFASDLFLLLHSVTALLIADCLLTYLCKLDQHVAHFLNSQKEEIWLTALLHDILKEANARGERLDHQDISPDDISFWLESLNVELNTTTPIKLAARIAMHERSILPLLSIFADVEVDDFPQLIIRLSDQLASINDINEHWTYEGHGLPRLADTLNGYGRFRGINHHLQRFGMEDRLKVFSHYHTQNSHPYLLNQILAGTVSSIRTLGPDPLLVMANGVVYIGTQSQCEDVKHKIRIDGSENLAHMILENSWQRVSDALDTCPVRPEDIRMKGNDMKIFAQMRLLGTPLLGDQGLFESIKIFLTQQATRKSFANKSSKAKRKEITKFVKNTLRLVERLPQLYESTLPTGIRNLPDLKLYSQEIKFSDLAKQLDYSPAELQVVVKGVTDPAILAVEFAKFGDSYIDTVRQTNFAEFEAELRHQAQLSFEPALRTLIDGSLVVMDHLIALPISDKRSGKKHCPTCGQETFKTKQASKADSNQRETFFPVKVKTHTNSGTGAGSDGTRIACQVCSLEFGLRGMGFSSEAFQNKQSVLSLHMLPFFAFPMNWLGGIQRQFGFRRDELRTTFNEGTVAKLYEALFANEEIQNDWGWIRKVARPLEIMTDGFFVTDDRFLGRDEFFGTPPLEVAGSSLLTVYTRRNERKPSGTDYEDEVGRTEMWTRSVMLAALLAEALPVRIVLTESPLADFDPSSIKSSLTFVNPPQAITKIIDRIRAANVSRSRYKAGDNAVSRSELRALLKLLIFAMRVNKTLGGATIGKSGRKENDRKSRRVVEIVKAISEDALVGAWLHQRDHQGRKYRPDWQVSDYQLFTKSCLEVDKMLDPDRVDRIRNLAQITQTFYAPPVYDSSHALTLPFKVATKTLQKFAGTKITIDELKTIMRSDIEATVRRQTDVEGSRAWIVLKRKKVLRLPDDPPPAILLTTGVKNFVDAFVDEIVYGITSDITEFMMLRKRLQSGYLIQMKDKVDPIVKTEKQRKQVRQFNIKSIRPMRVFNCVNGFSLFVADAVVEAGGRVDN